MFRLVKDASLGEYIITATISFVTASVVVAEHVIAVYLSSFWGHLSSFWGHLLTFLKELQAVARNVKDRMQQFLRPHLVTSDATTTKNPLEDAAEAKSMIGHSEQKHLIEEKLTVIPYAKLPPVLWSVRTIDDSPSH
ncbi:hypothetical protein ACHAO4_006120 [Trichoderma viride]